MGWFTTKQVEANSDNWNEIIEELELNGYSKPRLILELITMKAVAIMNACYAKYICEDVGQQRAGLSIEPSSNGNSIMYSNGFNTIVYNVMMDKWHQAGNNSPWFSRQYKEHEHITNAMSATSAVSNMSHNLAPQHFKAVKPNADVPATDDNPFGIDI